MSIRKQKNEISRLIEVFEKEANQFHSLEFHVHSLFKLIFLCSEYSKKEWCGLEWRAIKDIIKTKDYEKIMPIRFDDTKIDGLFSIDGYIDANLFSPEKVAEFIISRANLR